MELTEYLKPLRKWWWLLVAATLVAGVSSYLATLGQTPIYQSRTTLMIGRTIDDPNPTNNQFQLAQQLAESYADIANRELVRQATMEALDIQWLPQYVARALPNTQLIEITVTDSSPTRAQAVAQELGNQLIQTSPTNADPEEQDRQTFINQQLDDLELQISETQQEMAALQTELGELQSAREISDARNQITVLQTRLIELQSSYSRLLSSTERGAVNILTVIEPANLPTRPVNENRAVTIASAAAIGLMLAAGAAYLLEYLDKTIKTPEEVNRLLDTPVIGFIPDIREGSNEKPYIAENPRSMVAEAFRSLRTNMEFASVEESLETVFVTSAGPEAGKSSVAVNLAIIMAQGGRRVLLIDCDLRRPNVHGILGISNNEGLRDVFDGNLDIHDAIRWWDDDLFSVITAGTPPANPAELLGSKLMDEILDEVRELADVVILDGPPFVVADASILASKADGLLVVIRPGYTPKDAAASMMEQIQRVGARNIGVVFNRIPRGTADYYGKYWNYAPEYTAPYISDEQSAGSSMGRTNGRKALPSFVDRFIGSSSRSRESRNTRPVQDTQATRTPRKRGAGKNTDQLEADRVITSPPRARAVLRWEDHVGKRQKLVLREGDTILIGRDRINDVIIHSRHVSRRHAVITWRKELFEIADLGSTNGTKVNDKIAERPITLEDGDLITLFDVEIEFQTLHTASEEDEKSPSEEEVESREE